MTGRVSIVIAVVAFMAAGVLAAGFGYYVGTKKMMHASGSLTLQHVTSVSGAVMTTDLPEQVRKDLRLDVLTSLAVVARLRPDVSELNGNALSGLCFLRAVVLEDLMELNSTEREIAELFRPYLTSVSEDVKARTERKKPYPIRWCPDAQQAVQGDGPASGGASLAALGAP